MYGKFVDYCGDKVWVWCSPRDSEEYLYERAREIYSYALESGLRGFFLRQYIRGEKSMDQCKEGQKKPQNVS